MTDDQFQRVFENAAEKAQWQWTVEDRLLAVTRERDRYRDIAERLVAHGRAALTTQDEVTAWLKACEDLLELNSRVK